MVTVTRYHHGSLRAALVDAVIELVRSDGLGGVTMRSVARRAGVSEAAPYHHFTDKAALLAGAAAVAFEHLRSVLGDHVDRSERTGGDPADGLAEGWIRFALGHPGEYRLMFGRHVEELEPMQRPELVAAGGALRADTIAALDRALTRRTTDVSGRDAFPMAWAWMSTSCQPSLVARCAP
jgi:AcrR family transcriptional regulator